MTESPSTTKRVLLILGNVAMTVMWLRVLLVYKVLITEGKRGWYALTDPYTPDFCESELRRRVIGALVFSTIEIINSVTGLTRSKPLFVVIFVVVRAAVEYFAMSLLPCGAWQHLYTVLCWSLGEVVRFGCFALDSIMSSSPKAGHAIKSIRYTVGPIMFPLGALGEALIIAKAASEGRPALYIVVGLWPFGFYPLMKQLLRQRRKHFASDETDKDSRLKFV